MPAHNNQFLGFLGEDAAASHLLSLGYRILERNFKKPQGDIDIVAMDGGILVFVEVKTRRSSQYGSGEDAITPWKMRSLIRSAYYYKNKHPNLPDSLRIDVVSVAVSDTDLIEKISLYKNVTGG